MPSIPTARARTCTGKSATGGQDAMTLLTEAEICWHAAREAMEPGEALATRKQDRMAERGAGSDDDEA